jgi:hypothetical protein
VLSGKGVILYTVSEIVQQVWLARMASIAEGPRAFGRPGQQMARKILRRNLPFARIAKFRKPVVERVAGLLVVDFYNEQRTVRSEKLGAAAQHFAFAAFHINLDELRRRIPGGDESIERDDWNLNQLAAGKHRTVSIGFDAALRKTDFAAAKSDLLSGGVRPDGGVHRLKGFLQLIPDRVLSQPFDVFGIGVEGNDAASPGRANDTGRTQRERTQMRANVVDDVTRARNTANMLLYVRFVLAAPEPGFLRDAQAQPQTLRQSRFHLHPDFTAREKAPMKKPGGARSHALASRPTTENTVEDRPLQSDIRAIHEEVNGVHVAFLRKYPTACSSPQDYHSQHKIRPAGLLGKPCTGHHEARDRIQSCLENGGPAWT